MEEGGEEYPQENREIVEAALGLVCLKYIKFENVSRIHKRGHEGRAGEIPNFINEVEKSSIIRLFPTLNGLIGECSKPVEKQLTASDARQQQCRLLLNKGGAKECLLPLLNEDEAIVKGIDVTVYDSAGRSFNMVFKKWLPDFHVLAGSGWLNFLKKHDLKEARDTVSLWMFRNLETRKPCFAIFCKSLQEIASFVA